MRVVLFAVLVAFGAGVVTQEAKPTFEVASVRRQTTALTLANLGTGPRGFPGGVFRRTHITVASLVKFAYDLKDFQVSGGPEWVRQDHFDINAKAESSDAPVEQIRLMVQTLLEERFKLVASTEQRDMRYLAMVVARTGGELGPYLLRVDGECNRETAAEVSKKFPPRAVIATAGMMMGTCSEIDGLAEMLSKMLKVPVIDRTGLNGKFVYDARLGSFSLQPPASTEPADPALPPLPVALEEQLGLKLEPRQGPIDVLVIESVQQPAEN